MGDQVFDSYTHNESLYWECTQCALQNISSTIFDSSISSNESDEAEFVNKKKYKSLRISVCNFQSIWNKRDILSTFLNDNKIDVMIGSETHLTKNTSNQEIIPSNYSATRQDRTDGYGGIIIIYKNDIMIEEIRFEKCELVAIKIATYEKPIVICACYRPPKCQESVNTELIRNLSKLCKKYKQNPIWLAGDFNLPDIDWSNNTVAGTQYSKDINERFLDLFESSKLCQLIDFNTRKNAMLDLLFTNRPSFLTHCKKMPGFGDHDTSALADIVCHPKKIKPIQRTVSSWKRANTNQLRKDIENGMNIFCSSFSTKTPINTLWDNFKGILLNAQTNNVPTKLTSTRYNQPWFNRDCKIAIRRKNRKHKIYKNSNIEADQMKYKKAAKEARIQCNKARNEYIKHTLYEEKPAQKNKKLFTYIKHKRTDITGVSPLLDHKSIIQTDDKELAEILNKQFGNVFSVDDHKSPNIEGPTNPEISDIIFTAKGIEKLLKIINPKKASGPDKVSARILNTCSDIVANGLVLLFKASLEQGEIPNDWKHAYVTPLFKGGNKNRSKAENYRPISLTSITCKLMEHIIHSHIMHHFDTNQTLSDTQHGFRKFRSCETQLIQTINNLAKALNNLTQFC